MNYKKLHQFISSEMRMSQVYQPVMIIELLKNNGEATVQQIAQAIEGGNQKPDYDSVEW